MKCVVVARGTGTTRAHQHTYIGIYGISKPVSAAPTFCPRKCFSCVAPAHSTYEYYVTPARVASSTSFAFYSFILSLFFLFIYYICCGFLMRCAVDQSLLEREDIYHYTRANVFICMQISRAGFYYFFIMWQNVFWCFDLSYIFFFFFVNKRNKKYLYKFYLAVFFCINQYN